MNTENSHKTSPAGQKMPAESNEPIQKKITKGWFKWFLLGKLVLVLAVMGLIYQQYQRFVTTPIGQYSSAKQAEVLHIKRGDTAKTVANKLQQLGLMQDPNYLVWYLQWHKQHHLIKAGEITISPDWQVAQLAQALMDGKSIQYPVTIVAGQTFEQTLEMIAQLPKIERELDFKDIASLQALFAIEKPVHPKYPYANLEGWILPETYHYQQGDSDKQLLMRAYQAMQQELEQAWQQRSKDLPLSTPYEVLILASIVEKETGYAPERAKIAGVFENRIKRNMRLQTDPTIIYGMGSQYDGNIRKKDIREKTLYNTYQIEGLPPTPIASPSREAIWAVVQPEKTSALYFVAKGGGQHHFSNTLEEHNRAVHKYLLSK